jgi:hypothetical protein
MSTQEYIEHEVKIRVLEYKYSAVNIKLNALITVMVTGFAMPMLLKYFGG